MKAISTKNAPAAVGPYSQALDLGEFVFVSGQIPLDPQTNTVVKGGIEEQTRRVFDNIRAILIAAGLDMKNVVKTTVFTTDLSQFGTLNAVYGEYFEEPYPARSCVEVSALPKGALVKCEVIAKK